MYYDSNLYKNHFFNEKLLATLHRNIKEKTVEPFFQAIQDNKTSKVVKYEALMRLFDKDGNVIMPQVFLGKARKYRLFNKLMEILILKVIDYIRMYKVHVSINLDYNDILNPSMKDLIIKLREDVNTLDAVVLSAGTFSAGDNSKVSALTALDGRPGSVVMMDLDSGEVLCMVSSPTYDSNIFSDSNI